jgi:hypothetical protein
VTRCGDYYSIPHRLTALIRREILGSAVNVVPETLSMHVVPPGISAIVVPAGVTVLLGHQNPPHSWTDTVGPSLPDFTIALVWIPCGAIGRSGSLSLCFKTCIYTIVFEFSYSSLG